MKHVLLGLVSLLLSALAGSAAAACLTDTTQLDFQAGLPAGVDLTTSPGNVLLGTTSSGGTADQQNLTFTQYGDEFHTTQWLAQTFTPGVSGSLSRVDINLACAGCSGTPSAVTVSVRATSAGLPVGSDLASATIPTFSPAGATFKFYSANFAAPAALTARTQYAIVVRLASTYAGGIALFTDSAKGSFTGNDAYSGGALLISTNSGGSWTPRNLSGVGIDGVFITYMGSSGSGFVSSGNLTSSVKDSNPGTGSTTWSTLAWANATLPAGTSIKFQAAASNASTGPFNFVGPDGTAASFFTATNAPLSQFNGNRFLKYRAYLASNSSAATPTLNDATTCYSLTGSADLSITNTDGATTETPGTPVTYTITASNPAGSSSVTGATVTDTFPPVLSACTWTCTGANGGSCPASGAGNINNLVTLPGGASVSFSATCSIAASATGSLTTTASIALPDTVHDPNPANNSAIDNDTLAGAADLMITNSDGVPTANPGGTVTYTITASNPGPSSVTGATVADSFPQTLTACTWTSSGANGSTCPASGSGNINSLVNLPSATSVTFSATCAVSVSATGSLINTASITTPAGINDPTTANNSATDTDSLVAKTAVRLTVTDNVDSADIGDVMTYVINITNAGPSYADITSISDPLPAQLSGNSWICSGTPGATCKAASGNSMLNNQTATVPPGGTITFHFTATVVSDTAGGQFTNTVTATVSAGDPSPSKSASDTDMLHLFFNGFEGSQTLAVHPAAASGSGTDSVAMQLGVDAGLLSHLGSAPVTVVRGRSASGKSLFSVQLARAGGDIIARTLTSTGNDVFSDVSSWQRIDLKQHVIGLSWQSASARGGDGLLNVATGNSQMSVTGRSETALLSELQIEVAGDIPWLVPIEP